MYSLSANFRPSRRADNDGSVFYTISCGSVKRSLTSSIRGKDRSLLDSERKRISQDLRIIYCVIDELAKSGKEYTMDDVLTESVSALKSESRLSLKVMTLGDKIAVDRNIACIVKRYSRIDDDTTALSKETSLIDYINVLSDEYCKQGRRIGKSLTTLGNSLSKYLKGVTVGLSEVDEQFIMSYNQYLSGDVIQSTVAYYMTTLRFVVNHANTDGLMNLTMDWASLIHVDNSAKTRIVKTLDRRTLQEITNLDLSADTYLELIRDTFMFSFYTHGMELTDIAGLKKENLSGNTLQYNRRTSGKYTTVVLGDKALEIINRHSEADSNYLLPLSQRDGKPIIYQTVKTVSYRALQTIGEMLSPKQKLSFSMTRASWQSMIANINLAEAIV